MQLNSIPSHFDLLPVLKFSKVKRYAAILLSAVFIITISSHFYSVHAAEDVVRIGVLAKRGNKHCLDQWSATADYFNAQISEYSFEIVPLGFKEIIQTVADGKVDFVLANPAIYVELETLYGVSRVATMANLRQGTAYTIFGGVIITRADREDISQLQDLKGKSFAAVETNSFGGWIMALRELHLLDISPHVDFSSLKFSGTHDAVVYDVLNGVVDAGTVRTDTLERMAEEGGISLKEFKVLDKHLKTSESYYLKEDFPFLLSTMLYPEWPFARLMKTSDTLAKKVTVALLNMPADSRAASAARIAGWTPPLHYQPVHGSLIDLRIGPYEGLGKISLSDVFRQYWHVVLLLCSLVIILFLYSVNVMWLNRKLNQSRSLLARARNNLAEKVKIRTAALNKLNKELRAEAAERKVAEEKSRRAYTELDLVFNSAGDGMAVIDMDYNIMRINEPFLRLFGVDRENAQGNKCYDVIPGIRCGTESCPVKQVVKGDITVEVEEEKEGRNGEAVSCIVTATPFLRHDGEVIGIVESFKDITDRKRSELALAEHAQELKRSNEDLKQFAYVASHDLQEPLRMVSSYVQLLERRYKGKLDDDAHEFISYAVDGANRMSQLIQDLLEFSRVETSAKPILPVNCEEILDQTLSILQLVIEECDAVVTRGTMPVILADASQLRQLFQNLIGNALKFHGKEKPRVWISAEEVDGNWIFSVKDNGIGIDEKFKDRIFDIFQRLHGKNDYPGTGIGLAISKKIVERHGGKIWFESKQGDETTFKFSIPVDRERRDIAKYNEYF